MAGFYYFFRGRRADELARGEELDHNFLAHYGLSETLADLRKTPLHATVSNVGSNAGPGQSCGVALTVNSRYTGGPHVTGNVPDLQTWVPIDEEKGSWLGVLKNELPRPEDLFRWDAIWGPIVTDKQHYDWRIPVARCLAQGLPYGTLPQTYRFDPKGEPQPVLDKAYEWLWNLAGEIKDWYRDEGSANPRPHAWLVKTAARLLGVNYRLGIPELTLLHDLGRSILAQDVVGRICQTCTGYEVHEEAKKNSTTEPTDAPEIPTRAK